MTTYHLLSEDPDNPNGDKALSAEAAIALLCMNREDASPQGITLNILRSGTSEVWVWLDPYAREVDGVVQYEWAISREWAVDGHARNLDEC